MAGFSAILGTAACRPGNILLASRPSGGSLSATAAILAGSFLTAQATLDHWSIAALDASSSVVSTAILNHGVIAALDATSTMGVTTSFERHWVTVAIRGNGAFGAYPPNVYHNPRFIPGLRIVIPTVQAAPPTPPFNPAISSSLNKSGPFPHTGLKRGPPSTR